MRQARSFTGALQRPISTVPRAIRWLFPALLAASAVCAHWAPAPRAQAVDLPPPPSAGMLKLMSVGEPVAFAKAAMLWLQAFDNQPGISIPFRSLDYDRVIAWLDRILTLDPQAQYPLLAASRLYAEVDDPARQRQMLGYVEQAYREDPARRWPWIAHGAILARHRLKDTALALHLARTLREHAPPSTPAWARQMEILLLEEMDETQAAALLLGGLLSSGTVTDAAELRFLTQRLEALQARMR